MKIGWRFIASFALVSGCALAEERKWGNVDVVGGEELAQRQDIMDEVGVLYRARDFAGLSALEEQYRNRRSLTQSGTWKLFYYYNGLQYRFVPDRTSGSCELRNRDMLTQWRDAVPASPVPIIVEAQALESKAFCLRGDGYANTINSETAQRFHDTLEEAEHLLETQKEMASVDPQYYPTMINIQIGLGASRSDFEDLLEEAVSREPYYHAIYFDAFRYYQQKWYGQPGDIERLARFAAEHTPHDGMSSYARLYWNIAQCKCMTDFDTMDWPTIKIAMDDLVSHYPSDWNAANVARISCLAGRKDQAIAYFSKVQVEPKGVWASPDEREACLSS